VRHAELHTTALPAVQPAADQSLCEAARESLTPTVTAANFFKHADNDPKARIDIRAIERPGR
jgi:hypothetical protein